MNMKKYLVPFALLLCIICAAAVTQAQQNAPLTEEEILSSYTTCSDSGCDDFIFFDTARYDGVLVYLIIGPVDRGHPEGSIAVKWVFNPLKCRWVIQFVRYSKCKNFFPHIQKNSPMRKYLRQIKCRRDFPRHPYDWQSWLYKLFRPGCSACS